MIFSCFFEKYHKKHTIWSLPDTPYVTQSCLLLYTIPFNLYNIQVGIGLSSESICTHAKFVFSWHFFRPSFHQSGYFRFTHALNITYKPITCILQTSPQWHHTPNNNHFLYKFYTQQKNTFITTIFDYNTLSVSPWQITLLFTENNLQKYCIRSFLRTRPVLSSQTT